MGWPDISLRPILLILCCSVANQPGSCMSSSAFFYIAEYSMVSWGYHTKHYNEVASSHTNLFFHDSRGWLGSQGSESGWALSRSWKGPFLSSTYLTISASLSSLYDLIMSSKKATPWGFRWTWILEWHYPVQQTQCGCIRVFSILPGEEVRALFRL